MKLNIHTFGFTSAFVVALSFINPALATAGEHPVGFGHLEYGEALEEQGPKTSHVDFIKVRRFGHRGRGFGHRGRGFGHRGGFRRFGHGGFKKFGHGGFKKFGHGGFKKFGHGGFKKFGHGGHHGFKFGHGGHGGHFKKKFVFK